MSKITGIQYFATIQTTKIQQARLSKLKEIASSKFTLEAGGTLPISSFDWNSWCMMGYYQSPGYYCTSPNVFSMYAASSADALGTIPGSLNAVRSNVDITKINNQAATNGTAGESLWNKSGELKKKVETSVNF